MAVEFRCEKCGKILSVNDAPGSSTKCPHCNKKIVVPAALASMPRPQVPPGGQASGASARPGAVRAGGPQQPASPEQEEEEVQEDSAVMTVMSDVMPWVISVFFHVGLLLIMAFVTIFVIDNREVKTAVVPDASFSEQPGGVIDPGQFHPNQSTVAQTVQQRDFSKQESRIADASKTEKRLRVIGRGAASGGSARPGLTTSGSGHGPKSSFFGTGGNAHHVVYVVDRSGSMAASFDFVRQQMLKSISRLAPSQTFHIILFAEGRPIENPPGRLVPAEDAYRLGAVDFLMPIQAIGQTDPVPALLRAFQVLQKADDKKPGKLIYLLTDGVFPDNEAVLRAVAEANRNKDVHINTYLYGDQELEAKDVLERLANENGGRFKLIDSYE